MECRLVNVLSGVGETYPVGEGITELGRDSENDIQVMADGVSRFHAVINNMPTVCEIEDLESTNGTFLNGEKIERAALSHRDEIRLGEFLLRFEAMDAGSFTSGDSRVRDYSDRSQLDTIRIQREHPSERLSAKTKTSQIDPVSPLKPKTN